MDTFDREELGKLTFFAGDFQRRSVRILNFVKFFRRSSENTQKQFENIGEQTPRRGSGRKKSGCKALHVTQRRAFSTASEDAQKYIQ